MAGELVTAPPVVTVHWLVPVPSVPINREDRTKPSVPKSHFNVPSAFNAYRLKSSEPT